MIRTRLRIERLDERINPNGDHGVGLASGNLFEGHVDVFELELDGDELELVIHRHEPSDQDFNPATTVLYAVPSTLTTAPGGAQFAFLGAAPGSPLWVLPQTQVPGQLYLGASAEDIDPSALSTTNPNDPRVLEPGAYVRIRLVGFSGPGQFSVWQSNAFGQPVAYFSTADGINTPGTPSDTIFLLAGSHEHYNWGFTAAGTYSVTVQAVTTLANGTEIESEATTYTFVVNEVPPPEPPGTPKVFAVGPGEGSAPAVNIYGAGGQLIRTINAYDPAFLGGVRVAVADINGDGIDDVITVPGVGGGPIVNVFNGADGSLLTTFLAYAPELTTGIFVAAGDVNGDGFIDILTGVGEGGGPNVRVFSGADNFQTVLFDFMAYDIAFTGGVLVAAGDINGDGRADIITGVGVGGGPHVKAFSGADLTLLKSFMAYDPAFTGGVWVAAGDANGNGFADIGTAPFSAGGPQVTIFDGQTDAVLASFMALDPAFSGGLRLAVADINADDLPDLIVGVGPGGGPLVIAFDRATFNPSDPNGLNLFAYDPSFLGGVFVG